MIIGKDKKATLARYKDGTPIVRIDFPYSPEDISIVKRIPGRKYHAEYKLWTCPPTRRAIEILTEAGFLISFKLRNFIDRTFAPDEIQIPGLKKELFPYQNQGVSFLEAKNGRALIGDEMGLGKTIQAIGWLQLHPEIRPAVIVCPASVKLNWYREILSWMPVYKKDVQVLSGTNPYILYAPLLIINYDILSFWLPFLIEYDPQIIIADEIQYVKNSKAKRTKALRKLTKRSRHFIATSGTPIINKPIEFYNAIQMINADLFPNWMDYTRRYCDGHNDGFGWNVDGASNTEELHDILADSIMIRRLKSEVLTDLPDKIRSFFPIEMHIDFEPNYWEAENNFLQYMEKNYGTEVAERVSNAQTLVQVEILKQAAVSAKLPNAISWIRDFIDTGEKLVVFATHRFVIDELMKEFGKVAVKIDGRTTPRERQAVVDSFQNDTASRLFIGNVKAAGVGITLTASSNVAFLELPWTPGELVQAEDRCHRIGQKDTVNIYYLLAEGTIEERIAELLDEKRKVLDSILDGTETDESNLLTELIENYY